MIFLWMSEVEVREAGTYDEVRLIILTPMYFFFCGVLPAEHNNNKNTLYVHVMVNIIILFYHVYLVLKSTSLK